MVKAMILKNRQVIVTIPKTVVEDLKIEKGDNIIFSPGLDSKKKPVWCIKVEKEIKEIKE